MSSSASWLSVVRVETTVRQTFERESGTRKRAVSFKPDREIDSDATWMFSDGGSKGWCGLVILRPSQDARLFAREVLTETRNVGAEIGGLVSALDAIVPGERVVIVSDFLWSIYYVLGWYAVENPLLREQVATARALLADRRPTSLRFVHIKGHLRDDTALGRWNDIADRLCTLERRVDLVVPLAAALGARTPSQLAALLAAGTKDR